MTEPLTTLLGTRTEVDADPMSDRDVASMLEGYYYANGLYVESGEDIKPIRNPVYRCVEFYTATVWPGPIETALPIETENTALTDLIRQVWLWSNWAVKKQYAIRQQATTGDVLFHVATNAAIDKVYIQVAQSKNITEFDVDEQGHIDYLRYDVELTDDDDKTYWRTEVWDKEHGFRAWHHGDGPTKKTSSLSDPVEGPTSLAELGGGIDFVPWVWAPFNDTGVSRGTPPFWSCIEKIDEVCRKATAVAQMMNRYKKPKWEVRANAVADDGTPIPPPKFTENSDNTVTIGDDEAAYLMPGNSSLTALVPDIHWENYLASIRADTDELTRDLPEIQWSAMMDKADLSGKAVERMLSSAVSRAVEARGNIETALVRADKMALTIGKNLKLDGFDALDGDYDSGAFDHKFAERDVLPMSVFDRIENVAMAVNEAQIPLPIALKKYGGWEDDEIALLPTPSIEAPPEQQAANAGARAEQSAADMGETLAVGAEILVDRILEAANKEGVVDKAVARKKGTKPDGKVAQV